jgi:hypothetical protein
VQSTIAEGAAAPAAAAALVASPVAIGESNSHAADAVDTATANDGASLVNAVTLGGPTVANTQTTTPGNAAAAAAAAAASIAANATDAAQTCTSESEARRKSSAEVFYNTVTVMRAVVKFQSAYRRVCARRKMMEAQKQMQQRQEEGGSSGGDEPLPMVALKGTLQGTSGWYEYQDRQHEMVAKFDIDEQVRRKTLKIVSSYCCSCRCSCRCSCYCYRERCVIHRCACLIFCMSHDAG